MRAPLITSLFAGLAVVTACESQLAATIAANGPVAVRLAKRAIEQGAHLSMSDALELEWCCYQETLETTDRVEALAAFAEKRKPQFRGE